MQAAPTIPPRPGHTACDVARANFVRTATSVPMAWFSRSLPAAQARESRLGGGLGGEIVGSAVVRRSPQPHTDGDAGSPTSHALPPADAALPAPCCTAPCLREHTVPCMSSESS